MHWAKIEARWRDLEATRGMVDYTALDAIVDSLHSQRSEYPDDVTDAPDWARSSHVENGPPDDFSQFAAFVGALAARYAGRVQAYEIWNEPNLRREWNSTSYPISAEVYADLLRSAYGAIKAADPAAVVVSAGLAPTGFNDGINAIDDRVFLDAALRARAGARSATRSARIRSASPTRRTRPAALRRKASCRITGIRASTFSIRSTTTARSCSSTATQNKLIWVTRFGWGTSEDTTAPPRNSAYVSYNTPRAAGAVPMPAGFELGAQLGFVGVMIVYNLNSCTAQPENPEACYYSLIEPGGESAPGLSTCWR